MLVLLVLCLCPCVYLSIHAFTHPTFFDSKPYVKVFMEPGGRVVQTTPLTRSSGVGWQEGFGLEVPLEIARQLQERCVARLCVGSP